MFYITAIFLERVKCDINVSVFQKKKKRFIYIHIYIRYIPVEVVITTNTYCTLNCYPNQDKYILKGMTLDSNEHTKLKTGEVSSFIGQASLFRLSRPHQ